MDVINLQSHSNHLCYKRDLLLFADQGFYDMLMFHIIGSLVQTANPRGRDSPPSRVWPGPQSWSGWGSCLCSPRAPWVWPPVPRQRHAWVLLQGQALVTLLADHQGASDLGSAPAIHHAVVPDEVADYTQSVMMGMLGLLDDHLISSSDENGDGSEVLTLLDDQHLVFGHPKGDLFHKICKAQLLSYELREPRDDVATCGNGHQLNFRSSNLVNRWQVILEK